MIPWYWATLIIAVTNLIACFVGFHFGLSHAKDKLFMVTMKTLTSRLEEIIKDTYEQRIKAKDNRRNYTN